MFQKQRHCGCARRVGTHHACIPGRRQLVMGFGLDHRPAPTVLRHVRRRRPDGAKNGGKPQHDPPGPATPRGCRAPFFRKLYAVCGCGNFCSRARLRASGKFFGSFFDLRSGILIFPHMYSTTKIFQQFEIFTERTNKQ